MSGQPSMALPETSEEPAPTPADGASTPTGSSATGADPSGPTVRLWPPRDVLVASAILGFPGGLAVGARNLHRLGRRALAWLHLLAAPVLFFAILLLPEVPRGIALVLNVGIAAYLYAVLRSQIGAFEKVGGRLERASVGSGLATFLGGWVIVAVPLIVVLFIGSQMQGILGGTVAFGTGGSGCNVEAQASSIAANDPIHYVAYLSREVATGETVSVSLAEALAGTVGSDSLTMDSNADCVAGTLAAGTLPPGTYTFEFRTGSELLASGQLLVDAP